jgi:hypothetical protein
MTWKESNEFMKKVDKLESQKELQVFFGMWCTHVSEQNRTPLHLHDHFAN